MAENGIDDDDGNPVWTFAPGDPLVDDVVAWERLGVGYRCETWLGWSRSLWCPVAVKMARPHQQRHPRARKSLGREVAALENNPHPVLPTLIRDCTGADLPHIVLEYIDGPPLDEVAGEEPLDAPCTAMLATSLLSALMAVHRRNIAHVDIKPENVVIRDGRPVLLDFGLARVIGKAQPAGQPVGTTRYMSPEMEACQPISSTMDIYGVGATLREAYSGYSVYDNDPERRRIAKNPPYPPGNPELTTLITAMLAERPSDRPTVPEALDAFAGLFDPDNRPWPVWLTAVPSHVPAPVALLTAAR